MRKRKIIVLVFLITAIFFFSYKANAAPDSTRNRLIINNCSQIKETLKGIQRADTRARTDFLGPVYEEILDDYIKPLNIRLLKNDIKNKELTKNQEDFTNQYSKFKSDFTIYSRSLESLLNIDCKTNPDSFYSELETTRINREIINSDVEKLNQLVEKQKTLILELKDKYER